MNVNLKHWTGTVLVAVLAGFVIFGLLRGSEILNGFLKSEPIDANLERGELLEQIKLSPTPNKTPIPTKLYVPTKTQIPSLTPSPNLIPASLLNPTFSPILTPTPLATPSSTPTPVSSPSTSSGQASSPQATPTPTPSSTTEPTPEQSAKININTANNKELEKITGVGPVIAQRIIDYRNTNGLFQKIEDIKEVKGIGDVTFEKMKDEITVGY